ncbi:hypothetical protein [Micromonospora zhanjiangensis]|uniref:Uncharacterized protein n=1 Tax=Micromonospora zhanjiangensis TaxID=1522057 RepID=A0ABV8KFR0_9ACTN
MKAHRTDGVSLTFALLFLAVLGWWLAARLFDLSSPALGWFVAGGLILLGLLGLLGALRSGRPAGPPPAAVEPTQHADPTSGGGYLPPTSGGPVSGSPVSGGPIGGSPVGGEPRWVPPGAASVEPTTAPPATGNDDRS